MPSVKWGLAVVLAGALTVSQAQADGVLAPGKPAGVREAAGRSPSIWLIGSAAVIAVVGIGIAMAYSSNPVCGSACDNSTTTTTS